MLVSELQAERKRNELEPRDWDTYRAALIESGMVDEARERRTVHIGAATLVNCFVRNENGTRTLINALWEDHHHDDD